MTMTEIVSTPGVFGGKPRLAGYRIAVVDIAEQLDSGQTVAEVAESLDITYEEVKTAREYWDDHPEEIAAQRRRREELYEELVDQSRAQRG
jgi:uncharacterized protein (DUF433 family)